MKVTKEMPVLCNRVYSVRFETDVHYCDQDGPGQTAVNVWVVADGIEQAHRLAQRAFPVDVDGAPSRITCVELEEDNAMPLIGVAAIDVPRTPVDVVYPDPKPPACESDAGIKAGEVTWTVSLGPKEPVKPGAPG